MRVYRRIGWVLLTETKANKRSTNSTENEKRSATNNKNQTFTLFRSCEEDYYNNEKHSQEKCWRERKSKKTVTTEMSG